MQTRAGRATARRPRRSESARSAPQRLAYTQSVEVRAESGDKVRSKKKGKAVKNQDKKEVSVRRGGEAGKRPAPKRVAEKEGASAVKKKRSAAVVNGGATTASGPPAAAPASTSKATKLAQANKKRKNLGHVIVVGSGLSGLAAARELEHRGFTVTVIESRDRVGGRVWTHTFRSKAQADMGASYIHGIDQNPVAVIAERLGKRLHYQRSSVLYDYQGKEFSKTDDEKAERLFNMALEEAYQSRPSSSKPKSYRRSRRLDGQNPVTPTMIRAASEDGIQEGSDDTAEGSAPSVVQKKREKGEKGVVDGDGDDKKKKEEEEGDEESRKKLEEEKSQESLEAAMQRSLSKQRVNSTQERAINWHKSHLEYSLAVDLDEVRNDGWDEDDEYAFSGQHCMVSGGGIASIAQKLSTGLDLHLGTPVRRISYHENDRVSVEVSGGKVFHADACLVTVPLGVLKRNKIAFYPELPEAKQQAIQRLGFGVLDKVALVFPKVFWDPTSLMGYASEHRGEYPLFFDGSRTCGRPVLIALVSGRRAEKFCEGHDDKTVVAQVMAILFKIFGKEAANPIEYKVTRWRQDPHAYGSYSFISCQSSAHDYDLLAAPVAARPISRRRTLFRLFFAGEATNKFYPATIHGAFLSGIREARKISALFHKGVNDSAIPTGVDCLKRIDALESDCHRMAVAKPLRRSAEDLTVTQIRKEIIHNFTFPVNHLASSGPPATAASAVGPTADTFLGSVNDEFVITLSPSRQWKRPKLVPPKLSLGGTKPSSVLKQGEYVRLLTSDSKYKGNDSREGVVTFLDDQSGLVEIYSRDGSLRSIDINQDKFEKIKSPKGSVDWIDEYTPL